jgi:hypothetical protein
MTMVSIYPVTIGRIGLNSKEIISDLKGFCQKRYGSLYD